MQNFLAVGGGAALGAWLRWGLGLTLNPLFAGFPLGTWVANMVGGLLMGVALAVFQAVPDVPPMEVFWRVHFALGATIFTLSGMDPLRAICRSDFGVTLSSQQVNDRLLSFLAGGIRSALPAS